MIAVTSREYVEGGKAIKEVFVTFLGFTVYHYKLETTHNGIVRDLTQIKKTIVKGFNNED